MKRASKKHIAEGFDFAMKDYGTRKVQALFGTLSLRLPRLEN